MLSKHNNKSIRHLAGSDRIHPYIVGLRLLSICGQGSRNCRAGVFSFTVARLVVTSLLHREDPMARYDTSNKLRQLALRAGLVQDHWLEGVSVTIATALSAVAVVMLGYLLLMAQGWL
jgi:hypothetical protein